MEVEPLKKLHICLMTCGSGIVVASGDPMTYVVRGTYFDRMLFSSSKDGCVKIWSSDKCQVSEIILDSSLTSACFLNKKGDLVVGYKNHIFFIDHNKGGHTRLSS